MSDRKYGVIGGFMVRELPPTPKTRDNEVAKCFMCEYYSTRGEMGVDPNGKYICQDCAK